MQNIRLFMLGCNFWLREQRGKGEQGGLVTMFLYFFSFVIVYAERNIWLKEQRGEGEQEESQALCTPLTL